MSARVRGATPEAANMTAMGFKVAVALITGAWATGMLSGVRAEQGGSTWAGVYTEEQAKVGQGVYAKNCSECHGDDLGGDGFAPSLKGPEFMNNWNGLTVGELFERIRVSMPPSNPNALGAKEKAEIVTYLLKQNGFPAGKSELPSAADALKAIKFEATKPGR
jgi:S-disulfanyl-L-cysteine oxidoreductase SoxD